MDIINLRHDVLGETEYSNAISGCKKIKKRVLHKIYLIAWRCNRFEIN